MTLDLLPCILIAETVGKNEFNSLISQKNHQLRRNTRETGEITRGVIITCCTYKS